VTTPGTDVACIPKGAPPAFCALCCLGGRVVGAIGTLALVPVCGRHAMPDAFPGILRVRAVLHTEGLIP
jgi:hypothetical protein